MTNQHWDNVLIGTSICPIIFSICLPLFYFSVALLVGESPNSFYDPIGFKAYLFFGPVIWITAILSQFTLLIFLVCLIFYIAKNKWKGIMWKTVGITVGFHIVAILLVFSRLMAWFTD